MALKSPLAMATRGRIIPSGVAKTLAIASLGWILVGGVVPPPQPPQGGLFVGGGGLGGKHHHTERYGEHDEERYRDWELKKRIQRDDDEVLAIIKIFIEKNG